MPSSSATSSTAAAKKKRSAMLPSVKFGGVKLRICESNFNEARIDKIKRQNEKLERELADGVLPMQFSPQERLDMTEKAISNMNDRLKLLTKIQTNKKIKKRIEESNDTEEDKVFKNIGMYCDEVKRHIELQERMKVICKTVVDGVEADMKEFQFEDYLSISDRIFHAMVALLEEQRLNQFAGNLMPAEPVAPAEPERHIVELLPAEEPEDQRLNFVEISADVDPVIAQEPVPLAGREAVVELMF
ncbi:unnamed protein product [Caenorhabditis bovis]|uniref:Uncharacterized protein n=1 Tax=Caenorhabditis bovis TaxID=2654633 RepID=A0A8S1EHW4_9PELO|nr:unnamed protein product [Caenorhabditis bovis]